MTRIWRWIVDELLWLLILIGVVVGAMHLCVSIPVGVER